MSLNRIQENGKEVLLTGIFEKIEVTFD